MTSRSQRRPPVLGRRSWPETRRIAEILSKETIGGALLLGGALIGMSWANTPWAPAYDAVRELTVDELGSGVLAALPEDGPHRGFCDDHVVSLGSLVGDGRSRQNPERRTSAYACHDDTPVFGPQKAR